MLILKFDFFIFLGRRRDFRNVFEWMVPKLETEKNIYFYLTRRISANFDYLIYTLRSCIYNLINDNVNIQYFLLVLQQ